MPGHWTDPLGDDDPFPPDGCDCDHGWRIVGPAYPERLFPADLPALRMRVAELLGRVGQGERIDPLELRAAELAVRSIEANRASAEGSVFPCPRCRPTQYERWRAGCYRTNHHRASCRTCGPKAKQHQEARTA